MAFTVLVVEDDSSLRELVRLCLHREGMEVLTAASGAEGIALAANSKPDLVVLDLGLPDIGGEDVAHELRQTMDILILMLSAKDTDADRIRGFEAGADDYLTKPFNPRELVLRIQAILRRGRVGAVEAKAIASFGDGELQLDGERREVRLRGETVTLTPTEWGLLTSLAVHPGRVYSRSELVNRVHGYELGLYERTVDSHIRNLRRKLEVEPGSPRIVVTVLGAGYRLGLARDR